MTPAEPSDEIERKEEMLGRCGVILAGAALATACGGVHVRYPSPGETQTGVASYYDGEFVGRPTASGQIMDRGELTAAHRAYVFGTVVRVTNLDNGREVTVRINDRGPFVHGRIIDLTQAGARALDMLSTGIAHVRLEVTDAPPPGAPLYVQIGAFLDPENAQRLREQFDDFRVTIVKEGDFSKVRLGPCSSERDARKLAGRARKMGVPTMIVATF